MKIHIASKQYIKDLIKEDQYWINNNGLLSLDPLKSDDENKNYLINAETFYQLPMPIFYRVPLQENQFYLKPFYSYFLEQIKDDPKYSVLYSNFLNRPKYLEDEDKISSDILHAQNEFKEIFQEMMNFLNNLNERNFQLFIQYVVVTGPAEIIGIFLNEYFNHYLANNENDYNFFISENQQIVLYEDNIEMGKYIKKYLFDSNYEIHFKNYKI